MDGQQQLARTLILVLGTMVLGATGLFAQPESTDPEPPPAGEVATADKGETPTPRKAASTERGVDSPFDYQPSEEISEDLPVSFPVDI